MIKEAITFLLTPTTPIAKKYGFLYSSIALEHRFKRCKGAWLPHLKNCQNLYLQIVNSLSNKNSIVILGSAHLHEIPLHLLTEHFKKITLVDVVHPLKHHWLAKRNSRIELITQDLSKILDKLDTLNTLEDLDQSLLALSQQPLFQFEADLIISANLMSQLALLPIDSLEKKLKRPLTISEKDHICSAVANLHLQSLKQCQGKKLVYSDREVLYHDPQGHEIYRGHYPVDFSGYKKVREWLWQLAPLKEASKDYSITMKIEAYESI